MKRGFTLLELIVVIIILGTLATLGFSQYTRMIERSRGAEARQILGQIRTEAAALWVERNAAGTGVPTNTFLDASVGIGNAAGQIANLCTAGVPSTGYFFRYGIIETSAGGTATGFVARATRCAGAAGKTPGGPANTDLTLTLTTSYTAGTDSWGGNGGY